MKHLFPALTFAALAASAQASWFYHNEGSGWVWDHAAEDWIYQLDTPPLAWSATDNAWISNPLAATSIQVGDLFAQPLVGIDLSEGDQWIYLELEHGGTCSLLIVGHGWFDGIWHLQLDNVRGEALVYTEFQPEGQGTGAVYHASVYLDFHSLTEGVFGGDYRVMGRFPHVTGVLAVAGRFQAHAVPLAVSVSP